MKIADTVKDNVPKEFLELEEGEYVLVKLSSSRPGFVMSGDYIRGELSIVDVKNHPAVRVSNSSRFNNYIRTSPIVEVLEATKDTLKFRTEGGVYRLAKA